MSVSTLANNYLTARAEFSIIAGPSYKQDRDALRKDYCATAIEPDTLRKWVGSLDNPQAQAELIHRFEEWDRKIENGQLQKIEPARLSDGDFIKKVDTFYHTYQEVMKDPAFEKAKEANIALKTALLPELELALAYLKTQVTELVAKTKQSITEGCLNFAEKLPDNSDLIVKHLSDIQPRLQAELIAFLQSDQAQILLDTLLQPVFDEHGITDPELMNRIKNEWNFQLIEKWEI